MMDITMELICLFLGKRYPVLEHRSTDQDYSVKVFQIWNGETPQAEVLYILPEEQLKDFSEKKGKLCIGIQYPDSGDAPGYKISVNAPISLYQLVNTLQEIFQEFYRWRIEMEQLFCTHAAFEEIFGAVEQTFDLGLSLVDKNLQYIALSDSYGFLYIAGVGNKRTLPLEAVSELMDDEAFRVATRHDQAFLYHTVEKTFYFYCYNIKINGEYKARLLIKNKAGSVFPGGLALAEYVGKNIAELFAYYDRQRAQERVLYDFYAIVNELLQGAPVSLEEIRKKLDIRGWKTEHHYRVYLFQFIEEENALVTRRYYQFKIEEIFHDCCVLTDDNRICCVWNLSAASLDEDAVRQELSVFLRDNLCRVGVSQEFTDISQLHRYYLEAHHALALGLQLKHTAWHYSFASMVLPFIWAQATRELLPEQLCHPGIRILQEYDAKEGTELVATVREYMNHRYNVTATAKALFIHRTTLLFRLQRVELLTGIDWDSWEERLWIGVTLELLKSCRK